MSIYASFGGVDSGEHKRGCKRLTKKRTKVDLPHAIIFEKGGAYWVDDSRPCTCGIGPIVYKHSGVLPSDGDPRGGWFGMAYIPGHIDDATRLPISDVMQPCWPWLRIDVGESIEKQATVILTREQAESVRDSLNWWLENTPRSEPGGPR